MQVNHIKIKEIREFKCLRYSDLAIAADLSERRIQQIEQGKLISLNLNIARAIAKRLGVKLEEIAK
jgi:DNA-binding XRE family transcriptional regulator